MIAAFVQPQLILMILWVITIVTLSPINMEPDRGGGVLEDHRLFRGSMLIGGRVLTNHLPDVPSGPLDFW